MSVDAESRARLKSARVRKQAARSARAAVESAIVENLDQGVITLDDRGRVVALNRCAEWLLGCTSREALGRSLQSLVQPQCTTSIPLPIECTRLVAAIAGREKIQGESCVFERQDGSKFPVRYTIAPVRQGGHPVGTVLLFRDVSEWEGSRSAVHAGDRVDREILQHLPFLAWTIKPDGSVGCSNDEWVRYTGLGPEHVKRSPAAWLEPFHPQDRDRIGRLHAQGSSTPGAMEARIRRASDGLYRWHVYRWAPIRDAQRQVLRVLSTCVELHEADRHRFEILQMLECELRPALQPIVTGLRSMLTPAPPSWSQAGPIVRKQLKQISSLVDNLLDLAQADAGDVVMSVTPGDLRPILERALERIRPLIDEMDHELEVTIAEEALPANVDAFRLEQAFVHLLQNAAMYTPFGGRIMVSASCREGEISIAFADSGPGIGSELRSRLFLPVHRDKRTESEGRSLGIGLPFVREIVRRHGGTIAIRSAASGGSEVIVRFPAHRARPREAPLSSSRRILVVEDNPVLAENLAKHLRDAEQQVRIAYDAAAAIAEAMSFRPDIVFLDMDLPVVAGVDAARAMRRHLERAVLIGVLSRRGRHALVRDVALDYYINKPTGIVDVRLVLDQVAGRRTPAPFGQHGVARSIHRA